ncbi:PREDICTED: ATP synthase-coupling factor 6, mitochondrial-like [Dufourea novaeangliae]|uniref:ATP synthase-coupling factor 6, mitochondrial n=1 Tax=Dufourea novaeangliae TaxID=178035 RepID=A0A154P6A1_DUFNO|nr:PREDICTED: ATP synthase-coupling factor 6, mitochondrial-like [Dufourea novaeangliae]XP_015428880.1 PREDICTED: ATP synthase-coupling factor 6, mitochondrial-like [Dufourea novaeangliae]KZC07382.1 ATP synthase-coupling factor 6, mitochondrial [Dufourea novaeangliae]
MLTKRLATSLPKILKRNIGIVAPALQKASDPIQQLFIDKIHEYKSKSVGGKIVDPTPEIEKERKAELERLARQYSGSSSTNMMEFPKIQFKDGVVEK